MRNKSKQVVVSYDTRYLTKGLKISWDVFRLSSNNREWAVPLFLNKERTRTMI